ncbi:hypothetical protein OPQ81_001397 [Rhizoctonia solani]|nr:hypothetical protein OPQ81_001397 [Rhizoctonia solani]
MEVDQSLLSISESLESNAHFEKENVDRNAASNVLAPNSPVTTAEVVTPAPLKREPDSTSQPQKAESAEMSIDEEKMEAMIRVEPKNSSFAVGVRRESFPGKHLHTPDVSFNCEEVFIEERSYSSDVTNNEGMSFVYNARSSTPVSSREIPLPSTVQRTRSGPSAGVEPAVNVSPEPGSKVSLPIPSTNPRGSDALHAAPPNLRTTHPRSPLAFEVDTDAEGKAKAPSRESELISSEKTQLKSGPVPPMSGLKSISARAAALRFILPDESLMEMDSILDVQFPGGMEDEFTAAFARLALGPSSGEPQSSKHRSTASELAGPHKGREPVGSGEQESVTTVERDSGVIITSQSDPTPDEANGSYLEDEHTLNIASLGLSGIGNTLLVDMSLDQLRSKPSEIEPENATFGGSSFTVTDSGTTEWSTGALLEAQTPKRTASNPLPETEDVETSVEATVKKPRQSSGWVVSDAVVEDLRSGRALHRATNSISSINDAVRLANNMNATDERLLRQQVWPGSTASLRRTESFTSYSHANTAEPHQYPGSAVPLQRTRSTMSLRRTSSVTLYQPNFMRSHSRASAVDVDSEEDQPYTAPAAMVSRSSSRRSSIYALPEPGVPNGHPAPYLERPSSVASIYDRPTSAASIRPTSAASIRPTSAASVRTSSTRPTSAASSLRSGSAVSSRRVSGAHLQPSSAEDELVKGMEALMRGTIHRASPVSTTPNAQEAQNIRSSKAMGVEGDAQDGRDVARSGIRPPSGSSATRATGLAPGVKSALGPPKTPGSKNLLGISGSKHSIASGTKSTVAGIGSAKTMSAASGRAVPITPVSGTRSTTSTFRLLSSTKPSTVRTRASTLGLFAPDGGPGAGHEPKKPTHKASSASISATPSITRSLRPLTTASTIRTLSARAINATATPARAATTAGSIASLREATKSKATSKR